ncbi:hypothetical protein [Xanthomonas hortorum]|uniref:hypothetical protein n=1 Tax=Xanthomonas hortorum TaxID=56454 RepID=UPI00128E19F7|nr:hypothetical protein [Xanthomonas hortorum]MCC8497604.1 hypothetical protein [Xanthomonas hortorum pv. gardneri]MCC8513130.1 hypothetical protein [Xanthomonas hortorum pv. gardneri]MCC8520855.1 hypothetical protein [Xanthomonas hortorum pv. gardneri]MCC8652162.1 hypothetical protein [Xanthomonas hortorum pv. gardneri]MCC8658328.1 hypothetical protein [Xanthomonas hortorum pv. gardneri]
MSRPPAHGPIFSRVGASQLPGAIQRLRQSPIFEERQKTKTPRSQKRKYFRAKSQYKIHHIIK